MKYAVATLALTFPLIPNLSFAEDHAQRPTIYEGELAFGHIARSGEAVNSSGAPLAEIEDLSVYAISGMASFPIASRYRAQIEFDYEDTDFPDEVGGEEANDTYAGSRTFGLQLGAELNAFYLGGFAQFGEITMSQEDENSELSLYGLSGRWAKGDWTVAAQLGQFDTDAEDEEAPTGVKFAQLTGQRFLDDGNAKWQLSLGYGEGEQDTDSSEPDPVEFRVISFEAEQMLDTDLFGGATSVFGAAEYIDVRENSNSSDSEELADLGLTVGFRVSFGADSVKSHVLATAPAIPDVTRWIGATHAVD